MGWDAKRREWKGKEGGRDHGSPPRTLNSPTAEWYRINTAHWLSSRSGGFTEGGDICRNSVQYLFVPLAFETFEPINRAGWEFVSFLGHRHFLVSYEALMNRARLFNCFFFNKLLAAFLLLNSQYQIFDVSESKTLAPNSLPKSNFNHRGNFLRG
jgi:hypothetical protein